MNYFQRFEQLFSQCDKHIKRLNSAYKEMEAFMPLDEKQYSGLDDIKVRCIDQFLFRFAKLQDVMGQKLFRLILLFLEEDIKNLPFIDMLNKLEKLNLINANQWRELREIRNELAHSYDDEAVKMSMAINKIFSKKRGIEEIYEKQRIFIENRLK